MAGQGQRRSGGARTASRGRRRDQDNTGIIPVLAQAVREVENGVLRGRVDGTRFQVVALLVREERARLKADATLTEQSRATELKRLDGIATILAQTAASDPRLFDLLAEDAEVSDSAHELKRELQRRAGYDVPDPEPEPAMDPADVLAERRSIRSR